MAAMQVSATMTGVKPTSVPSKGPLIRQLGSSKRQGMQSLAMKASWEAPLVNESAAHRFVRPDEPPIESAKSVGPSERLSELVNVAANNFNGNKFNAKPKFRSALEQVSWTTNSSLWEDDSTPVLKRRLGFLGL